jgi:hypothetical protein
MHRAECSAVKSAETAEVRKTNLIVRCQAAFNMPVSLLWALLIGDCVDLR